MNHCGVTKRRRTISVTKLRLTLVAFLAMQFPNLICNITSQLTSFSEQKVQHQTFQNIDFSNISLVDLIARRLMQKLHDELDFNDDGNVSLDEGAKFINREDFESESSNLPGFATDKDGRITEAEFWDSWVNSTVHNWTVSEMVQWLTCEVELPQYAEKFKFYGISGAAMPILAGNNSVVLSLMDGVKEHRLKLWLKAMEVVLCGYTKPKSHFLKDVLLSISIPLAFGGVLYAMHVRRTAAAAVAIMKEKLDNLQNEMKILEEEEQWLRDETRDDLFQRTDTNSSQSSLESESSSLYSRLNEVLDELNDTRMQLEQTEAKLNNRKWKTPERLIVCLKETHKVEMKLHESKRELAQKKVEQAKSQFLKMKKKASFFNHIQLLHSKQVDTFDVEIELAKEFLREVQRDSHEYKKRWREIETICQLSLSKNHVTSVTIHNHSTMSKFARKQSDTISFSVGYASSEKEYDKASEGLVMKDVSHPSSQSNDYDVVKSTPQMSREHRRNHSMPKASTLLSVASSNHKSPSPIPEESSSSENLQTISKRRSISPSNYRKTSSPITYDKYKHSKGTNSVKSDVTLTSSRLLSKSTSSLPELASKTALNFRSASEDVPNNYGTLDRKLKKRSLKSSFLKKFVKS